MAGSLKEIRAREFANLRSTLVGLAEAARLTLVGEETLFSILGVKTDEIVASNFLKWVMDPFGSHGMGSWFLDQFLGDLMRRAGISGAVIVDPNRTEIHRELAGPEAVPDIVIVDRSQGLVCIIENKLLSTEGHDQTGRTLRDAMQKYGKLTESSMMRKPTFVYLTPRGHPPPQNPEFFHIFWEDVVAILRRASAHGDAAIMISHFVRNMEVEVMPKRFSQFSDRSKLFWQYAREITEVTEAWWQDFRSLMERVDETLRSRPWYKDGRWSSRAGPEEVVLWREAWRSPPSHERGASFWLSVEREDGFPEEFSLSIYHDEPRTRKTFNEALLGQNQAWKVPCSEEGWVFGKAHEQTASIAWKPVPLQVDDGEGLVANLVHEFERAVDLFGRRIDNAAEV